MAEVSAAANPAQGFALELYSWEQGKFAEYVDVRLIGVAIPWGASEILPGHEPTIFALAPGLLRIRYVVSGRTEEWAQFAVHDGVMTVDGNKKAVILAPEFITAHDVTEEAVLERIAALEADAYDPEVEERLAFERACLTLCRRRGGL